MVRVSVSSGARRVDLVLPSTVPVAELVPELARSVGLLDAASVYAGYQVLTAAGRALSGDRGLVVQGVMDGGLLTVTAGVDAPPPRVYDDLVEAMADVVERDLEPWSAESGRRTALIAAGLLMAFDGGALFIQHDSLVAGVSAGVVSALLVAAAIVFSRVRQQPEIAVAVAWMGSCYAALGALMVAIRDGQPFLGGPLACAGAGALVAGLVCVVGLGDGRVLTMPPAVVGAMALATGLVLRSTDVDAAVLLAPALVLVVLAGSAFPALALGVTQVGIATDRAEIDAARVAADARIAHQILAATSASVGILLVLVAPAAVSLGLSGALLAADACVVVMLRTRRHYASAEVLVGLASGILGLASVAMSLLWMHPGWRSTAAVTLAATGAVLLTVSMLPGVHSLRLRRLGDLAESLCLVGLLPLLVLASGLLSVVRP